MTPLSAPAVFRSAQFEGMTPNPRSISTRFVFAEVKASAIKRVRTGESGEGLMAEVELTRSADNEHRACERTLDRLARHSAPLTNIGRSPHTPWRAVKEAKASAPSPAWLPGRRGCPLGRGAQPSFARPAAGASRRAVGVSLPHNRGGVPSVSEQEEMR